ncbi:hypothetical protein Cni_G09576 [Canna indica]|uniref:Sorting nexin C-terminal domain-containing protein n=1 Tax=Canna indica TaxID=4628 RepID=A0AAQ3K516_9LILI|nr:hypothetical protein Cni_G09576 [Canna indica]
MAVNVDDAVHDLVCQFKTVSDGLMCKDVRSSPSHITSYPIEDNDSPLSSNHEEKNKRFTRLHSMESSHSFSEDEENYTNQSSVIDNGWHSDNELYSKRVPSRIHVKDFSQLESQRSQESNKFYNIGSDASKISIASDDFEGPDGMPQEWTPPHVSVPLLDLVDKIFQLKRRGWLRRQVYWISKQISQLMMEDAIDDWILRQIHWLRREDVIAQGIRWVQDLLWPDGTFYTKLESAQCNPDDGNIDQKPSQIKNRNHDDKVTAPSSFEAKLEAARRAEDVKKMLLSGAPSALVSLIGASQYRRSARDIYYFLQSTICIKQLAYSMLDVVLVSIFPELQDSVHDIHEQSRKQSD